MVIVAGLALVAATAGVPIARAQTSLEGSAPPPSDSGTGTGAKGVGTIDPGGAAAGVGVPGGTTASSGSGSTGPNSGGDTSSCQWLLMGTQAGGNGIDTQGNVLPGAAGGISGETHHVPCYAGLTGLNSGLWATVNGGPIPPITAKATIRGYTVSVTAHPVAYHWDMGNGNVMLGTSAGSQDDPSIDYMYQESGTYTLSLTVTWTGTYTFGGNGIASETSALGPVDQAPQQLSWPVQQIRSVLIAPGAPDTTTTIAVANGC